MNLWLGSKSKQEANEIGRLRRRRMELPPCLSFIIKRISGIKAIIVHL
jgi:hypothetical protein